MPPGLLASLTYTARRGERRVEHVETGEPKRSFSVQGIHRLAPASAAAMAALVAG